jgi:cation diffusion facilitator CzcD-associated flavoprotein CzcO
VTFSKITEITEEGVVTDDGTTHKLDVLVCGTGFDVSFVPRFPIFGTDGLDLRDAFKDSPETYLSTMACDFPNYFSKPFRICPPEH